MRTTGGTDVDWLIEHNGSFLIFEFKKFHDDKISIKLGQMIAYERLHENLNRNKKKCYLYFVGTDEVDFTNLDFPIWLFEMSQWKNKAIPYEERLSKARKLVSYTVERAMMEELILERLQRLIDYHWKEFEEN